MVRGADTVEDQSAFFMEEKRDGTSVTFQYSQGGPAMIVAESQISLNSNHQKIEEHKTTENLLAWQTGEKVKQASSKDGRGPRLQAIALSIEKKMDKVSLSTTALATRSHPVKDASSETDCDNCQQHSLNMRILKAVFEKLTGKKIFLRDPGEIAEKIADAENAETTVPSAGPSNEPKQVSDQGKGWGLAYDYHESHYEYEATSFDARGVIKTGDEREIDFSVALSMSREFMSESHLSIRAGDALKDPLVINYDGAAAELTQTSFAFDIDMDGKENQISFVAPGSGFLSLDKNKDGVINDGSELFGALTGDGFSELTEYDLDGNGWIDESDSIYHQLRIWSKDQEGNDYLLALGEQGIGAVYLGHVSSPFEIKDENNQLQGQVRSSGIFLYEDGRAGTMQQVDLVA